MPRTHAAGSDGADPERLTPRALYRAVLLAFGLGTAVLIFPTLAGLLLLMLLVVIAAVPLSAATGRLERLRIPRGVGAPLMLIAGLGVLGGLISLLVPAFVSEGQRLVDAMPSIVDSLRRTLGQVTHSSPGKAGQSLQSFVSGYTNHPAKLLGPATAVGAGLAGLVATLVVLAITALYMAIRPEPLVRGALRLVTPPHREEAHRIMRRLARAYVGWLRGLAAGMLVLWVITYLGLRAVGLPFAVVFATLTALAMTVPYYGALVSAIPPVLLALTISPGKALIVAAIYLASHEVEGNIIEPLIMARALELHPALVAVGVVAVDRLFGFVGLMVAVPILVTAKILVEDLWVRPTERAWEVGAQWRRPPGHVARRVPSRP
jgi:predicted PurR-regulated permease PerM